MAEKITGFIQEIPTELLNELAVQIRHHDFQTTLVGNATGGHIEAKDVIEQFDRQLIADGNNKNDQNPSQQKVSQLYTQHKGDVEVLVKKLMPDRGVNNKDKYDHVIRLLEAIEKAIEN